MDFLVQLEQLRNEVKLPVQRTGIGLDVQGEGLAAPGLFQQTDLPVVHIRALGHLSVHKDQELGVLTVVPLLDLGLDLHPDGFAGKVFRHGQIAAEPVVAALDAVEVTHIALEFTLKLIASVIFRIPAHGGAVKRLPGGLIRVRFLRAEEKAGLILPLGNGSVFPDPQQLQLVADNLNSLVDKIHVQLPHRLFSLM